MSYIELEAAVTAVDESPCWRNSDDWFAHASVIEENLRAIPAADVRPVVRGKWIKIKYRSICRDCSFHGFASWNYCPNCGRKMTTGSENG